MTSRTRRSGSGPKSRLATDGEGASGMVRPDAVPTIQCRRAIAWPAAVNGFAGYSGLADTGAAGQHDAAGAIAECASGFDDDRELLRSPNKGPLADHRQILTARQCAAWGCAETPCAASRTPPA